MHQPHKVHNFNAKDEWNSQLGCAERVCHLNAPELFLHRDIHWDMPVM